MRKISRRSFLAAAAAVSVSGLLAACGGAADSEVYTVGICQLLTHPALDAATDGFKDGLVAMLGEDKVVKFDSQDAGGEYANCATIVDGFVANNVDLILANATAPLQAAASATGDIPVLGTSVTDYATALNIADWTGTVGGNISGTSDLAPLDQQAAMIKELFPDAKTVGLLYCSAEPNSVYQIETIANVVLAAGVPVVAGEEGICSGCGVATLSISYYDLGYATGEMAAKILTGEADVSTMPVAFAPNVTKKYNAANCDALKITVPADYEALG